jgi:hypothetical protein
MGDTSGAETVHSSGAPEFTPGLYVKYKAGILHEEDLEDTKGT